MAGANLFVFRENAETVSGSETGARLCGVLLTVLNGDSSSVVDALLLAGEVECALSDCGRASAGKTAMITDALASRFVGLEWKYSPRLQSLAADVAADLPEILRLSPPEGFAHYGLHPGDFADAVARLETRAAVGVVGIRSVGTTLSAVALATLKRKGVNSSRITVRPVGHPYGRQTELGGTQASWVRERDREAATFLIVDEGPGLSGSSFLSTAECLVREGIAPERITLMGTRDVDPAQLCAADASRRWQKFGWKCVPSRITKRFEGSTRLSGGLWRGVLLSGRTDQPACWPEMDAVKYWSRDRRDVFKFEGFGEGGKKIRQRATALCKAGFGPPVEDGGDGMSRYPFLAGRALARGDLSAEILDWIARYCDFRAVEFKSDRANDGVVEEAIRFNYTEETGQDCPVPAGTFRTASSVICDGRMSPHEWIRCTDGKMMKVDGCKHGDDHFLPGPTDIAWDLAGAIVECDMDLAAETYFLDRYRARSGTTPDKIPAFALGYSIFRACYCKMASMGTGVESEKPCLQSGYLFYRRKMNEALARLKS